MSNKKILVVEDDADVRLGYRVLLRAHNYDTFFAADITSASTVEMNDGHMDVTIWKPGQPERVVRKH